MTTIESNQYNPNKASSNQQSVSSDFSAPLGMVSSARLIFASGAEGLEVMVNPSISYLYQARFRRFIPHVSSQEGMLTIEYKRFPFPDRLVNLRQPLAEVRLNGSISWEIEFRKSVAELKADLGALMLRSIDVLGGASHVDLVLPKPSGTTYIYISGGIHNGAFRRPIGVGVRVQVNGGIRELTLDDRHFGAVDREMILVSSDFKSATDRYDICITGGAGNLVIDKQY